ncbi:MAG: DNA-formamidopyrimidine glycosylase [Faecalibacillus sp.]
MPELPEVETVKRTLENYIIGKKIKDVHFLYPQMIDGDCQQFKDAVIHQTFRKIDRVGKYLIFQLDTVAFVSHLRMEGKYLICQQDDPISKHDHVIFDLDDQQLRYNDVRKFGRMKLVDHDEYKKQLPLCKLGPEPFDAYYKDIYKQYKKRTIPIKTALLDQSLMAGIGNIYANEICYAMHLNPQTAVNKLTQKRVQELIDVSRNILNSSIQQGGTTIHSFSSNGIDGLFQVQLKVHGKKQCPLGHDIKKIKINGRGTYYCPVCQKARK